MKEGCASLKIKVGEDLEKDVEKIRKVREHVGDDVELRLDANQGWGDYWTALKAVKRIEKYDINILEQPLPYSDLRGTALLRKAVRIPIMLDENAFD